MNVTFMIGNGLDIAFGLNTGYDHFLKWYREKDNSSPSEDKTTVIEQFRKAIRDDSDSGKGQNWSDLELAFGKYTGNLQTPEEIEMIYKDLLENIQEYIEEQENLIDFSLCKEEILLQAIKDLPNFFKSLRPVRKNDFLVNSRFNTPCKLIKMNYITFNYTSCLEQFLTVADTDNKTPISKKINGVDCPIRNIKPLHIHGSIKNFSIIFGVDNREQLSYSGEIPDRILRRVIKPIKNENNDLRMMDRAKAMINESTVICIFGMSMGLTDGYWWKSLGIWLKEHSNRQLLIYKFSDKLTNKATLEDDRKDIEEEEQNIFFEKAEIEKKHLKELKRRVHILTNTDVFQINLRTITDEKQRQRNSSLSSGENGVVAST